MSIVSVGTEEHHTAREVLRARIFLRVIVPLLEVIMTDEPVMARVFSGMQSAVQIGADGSAMGARMMFNDGRLQVVPGVGPSDLRIGFKDLTALNTFFAGKLVLPRLNGGLRHPVLLMRVVRLLSRLQVLQPQAAHKDASARALRVKLLLYLVTQALAELHHGGHAAMMQLVEKSPDRVYQWTVQREGIGAWLRMKHGRVKAGYGAFTGREPFVHFVFPTVDAALTVLTATGSQMDGVRDGSVEVIGSPEYSRKISLMMQQVDELLVEG